MKIHIGKKDTQFIAGYVPIIVEDQEFDLSAISDNECTEILANEILDEFDLGRLNDLVQTLISKLRMGGKLVIGGTDILLFCKGVLDGSLTEVEWGNMITLKRSMTKTSVVLNGIRSMGLNVEIYDVNGVHYEITVRR